MPAKKKQVQKPITEPSEFQWRENIRRVIRILRPLLDHKLIAAVCDMDTVIPDLIWKRLYGASTFTQTRDRKHSAFLRVFLENLIKALEIAFFELCESEKKRWGFNLPIDQQFEQEVKDLFALMVANQQERSILLIELEKRWPRILFRGRTERTLFSQPWIVVPRLDLPFRGSSDLNTSPDPQWTEERNQEARMLSWKKLKPLDP